MSKYYAVRKGKQTGVFRSWDECKEATSGYKGAEFKSFLTEEEAKQYMDCVPAPASTDIQKERYEITYTYNEEEYTVTETPTKGFEAQFAQKVLNRIESIVDTGAVIIKIANYNE